MPVAALDFGIEWVICMLAKMPLGTFAPGFQSEIRNKAGHLTHCFSSLESGPDSKDPGIHMH